MAVTVHICPTKMSREEYERVIKELQASGCSEPRGRVFHAAYGNDDVQMFEIWETHEQFEAHRDDLMSALECAGVDGGAVDIHSLHSPLPD